MKLKLKLFAAGTLLAALVAAPGFAADTKDTNAPRDTPKSPESMKTDDMKKSDDTMRSPPKAEHNEAMKRARADWKSAKEACGSQSGAAKDSCMQDAKKTYDAAKADAKGGHKSSKSHPDADKVVRSGQDDEALKAKCAAMTGDAKETCMADGKKGRQ